MTPHAWYVMGFAGVDQPGGDAEDLYVALQDDGIWANLSAGAADAKAHWHNRKPDQP